MLKICGKCKYRVVNEAHPDGWCEKCDEAAPEWGAECEFFEPLTGEPSPSTPADHEELSAEDVPYFAAPGIVLPLTGHPEHSYPGKAADKEFVRKLNEDREGVFAGKALGDKDSDWRAMMEARFSELERIVSHLAGRLGIIIEDDDQS